MLKPSLYFQPQTFLQIVQASAVLKGHICPRIAICARCITFFDVIRRFFIRSIGFNRFFMSLIFKIVVIARTLAGLKRCRRIIVSTSPTAFIKVSTTLSSLFSAKSVTVQCPVHWFEISTVGLLEPHVFSRETYPNKRNNKH